MLFDTIWYMMHSSLNGNENSVLPRSKAPEKPGAFDRYSFVTHRNPGTNQAIQTPHR